MRRDQQKPLSEITPIQMCLRYQLEIAYLSANAVSKCNVALQKLPKA
jgi:hypothetical protein